MKHVIGETRFSFTPSTTQVHQIFLDHAININYVTTIGLTHTVGTICISHSARKFHNA